MTTNRQIGHLIIDEIIKQRMFRAEFDGHAYLFIWQGNSAEQLEALVEQHYVQRPSADIYKPNQDQVKAAIAHKIIDDLKRADRLSDLSHRQLIEEACNQGLGENLIVLELMNRVLPGWEK